MMRRWICSQIGAREHYAVPRALSRMGKLNILYTDWWAGPLVRKIKFRQLSSWAGRFHPDLAHENVRSWNLSALGWEAGLRRRTKRARSDHYHAFIAVGQKFACAVRDRLRIEKSPLHDSIFFSYDTGALETLEWLLEKGVPCVVDQMDPNRIEIDLIREEEKKWPGWAISSSEVPEEYFQRREKEWRLADRIVVNSDFSRRALIQQGVPSDKVTVIPVCYQNDTVGRIEPKLAHTSPLKVLFLGQVVLRKGIQYLVEAAKMLEGEPIHFDIVGPCGISREAVNSAPPNMTFHGRASRDQTGRWYRESDIFVLPTLSDGFAITQIEAMAHGLPVISTPNCGAVVTHGVDGFIEPVADPKRLAQAILQYLTEPTLLAAHRISAVEKSKSFDLDRLRNELVSLEESLPCRLT